MNIAIIGAGLTGLITGKLLQDRGHSVSVFEKSRGRGGRLATKRLDWGNIDIGAQYFTARSDAFRTFLQPLLSAKRIAKWEFTPYKLTGEGLQASPDHQDRFVGTPDMNSMAHWLADGLDIRFQQTVVSASQVQDAWAITTTEGGQFSGYDWLICTTPLEQANQLIHSNNLSIEPALPDHCHLPCWAVVLHTHYNGKYFNPEIQGIFGDHTVSWVSRLNAKPFRKSERGKDRWLLHFSPEWSLERDKSDHPTLIDDIPKLAHAWLQQALAGELVVIDENVHYWRYANIKPEYRHDPIGIRVNHNERIAIGGDWSMGGRIEGAYLAAIELINELT